MLLRRYTLVFLLTVCGTTLADDPPAKQAEPPVSADAGEGDEPKPPPFELSDEVSEVLVPLFSAIAKADVSRATVEMLTDSLVGGTVVDSQKATYQIASQGPDSFTIYLKEPEQRRRIYNNGDSLVVAVAPDAFFKLPNSISMQEAVTNLPVPMGPYPEPILALTLAGVDPAISFVSGMKSVEIVDRKDFRGKVPAIHLRGVQSDAVTWDFWVTKDQRKPLRLLIDLTPMLIASPDVQVPEHFSYQVRFDFLSWRVTGEIDKGLFVYTPPKDAKEYESLEDYYQSISQSAAEHPLLGKPAPAFTIKTLSGKEVDSKQLKGRVVVLDFWASWCSPCLEAIPIIQEVTAEFADKDVVFLPLNTGETAAEVTEFLKKQEWDIDAVLDPDETIADTFVADAIPLTVIIGKGGAIESVHIGFLGKEALKQRLTDELEVLSAGGMIASAPPPESE